MKRVNECGVIYGNGDISVAEIALSQQEYTLKSIMNKIYLKQYEEAFLQVEEALSSGNEENPIFVSKLTALRATIYNYSGNWSDAITDLEMALAIDPCSCDALVSSARIYFNLGKYKESADCIIQACKIDVDQTNFFGTDSIEEAIDLSDRLSEFGEHELALLILDQLKLLTNVEYIEKSRLYNLILLGREDEAKKILEKIKKSFISDLISEQFEDIDEETLTFDQEGLIVLKYLYKTAPKFRDEINDFMIRHLQVGQLAFADVKEILLCANSLRLLNNWLPYISQEHQNGLNLALAKSSNITTLICGINELSKMAPAIARNRSLQKIEVHFSFPAFPAAEGRDLYSTMVNSKSAVHWIFCNQNDMRVADINAINKAVCENSFITFVSPYRGATRKAHQAILAKSTRSLKCFEEFRANPFKCHTSFSPLDRYVLNIKLEDYCNNSKPKVDAESMRIIHDYMLNKNFIVAIKKIFQKCVVNFDSIAKSSNTMLTLNDAKRTVYLPDNVYAEIAKHFVNALKISYIGMVEALEKNPVINQIYTQSK